MATRTTDTSSSEEEIYYTYYSSTECESDFEYEGKAGYKNTCEPEYSKEELGKLVNYFLNVIFVDRVVDFFNIFFLRAYFVANREQKVFFYLPIYMLKIKASYRINNHLRKNIRHIYLHLTVACLCHCCIHFISLLRSHDIKTIKRVFNWLI